jgi:hypothetical protein
VPQTIDANALRAGIRAAMIPTPYEIGKYNIMTSQYDNFNQYFDSTGTATIWAPLLPLADKAQLASKIRSEVTALIDSDNKLGAAFTGALGDGIEKYLTNAVLKGAGEDGETFNYVRIQNPFLDPAGKPVLIPKISINNPADVKTSWADAWNKDVRDAKRIGYSVKTVSFDSLYKNLQKTDGATSPTNPLKLDSEADEDVPLIKH